MPSCSHSTRATRSASCWPLRPGIGAAYRITLALGIDIQEFASGRHFAAWLGLTPKEHSTGGKQRMGRISKAGNERLRSLLVVGATAVIRYLTPGKPNASAWLLALTARKPPKLAAVALANKTARIVWAMMVARRGIPASAGDCLSRSMVPGV